MMQSNPPAPQPDLIVQPAIEKPKSFFDRLRSSIIALEAIELPLLIAGLYTPIGLWYSIDVGSKAPSVREGMSTVAGALMFGFAALVAGLFLWGVYLLYIRIARWGGANLDVAMWIIASLVTATFTFWCWSVLDINRLILSKLFYRGEAPVEFAWSATSKRRRKEWESAREDAAYLANLPS